MKTATELRAAFAARELSPVELIDGAAEDPCHAFVTFSLARAREEAKAAERAYRDGTARPLEGLALAVKDLYDTAGIPTAYGSSIFTGRVPPADAELVARARAAGAIVVGKTLTHEFAWGITSQNPHYPPGLNPWDRERVPGGSSGGSAIALATGQVALALGTDTGGSIRIPAAFCGVSGIKPTFGRLPSTGIFPLAPSLDHPGPMARTPADVRLFYEALAGPALDDGARALAVCPDLHRFPLDPDVQRVFDAAAAGAVEVRFDGAELLYPAYVPLQMAEAWLVHAGLFTARRDAYGADVASRIELSRAVTLADYALATLRRERIRTAFARIFTEADLLLTPIAAIAPEPRGGGPVVFRDAVLPYTVPQDVAGLPACAVPVGFDDRGLPIGVQLTGPPCSEGRVLAAADELFTASASARAGFALSR